MMREEIFNGYDPDGAQQGGPAGVFKVLKNGAIDSASAADEALSVSVVDDRVVAEAIDGTSYYSVLSTMEPEVLTS